MRAMQYRNAGGPDQIVIAEVQAPRPTATQLLLKVSGSSVNPVDWKLRNTQGLLYRPVRFPSIPGADISGEVVEIGAQVTRFKPGDRLFAMANVRFGAACAEYAVVEEQAAARAHHPGQGARGRPRTAARAVRRRQAAAHDKQDIRAGGAGGGPCL
jgi:NADPH:quinone reductase-like Zn-dependent oxidoreductase